MFVFVLSLFWFSLSCWGQYASSGCGKALPGKPGTHTSYNMGYDGYNRVYIVYIPKNFNQNSTNGQSVIFALPGYTNTAQNFMNYFEMNSQADEYNYLAVYLQGTSFTNPDPPHHNVTSWNDEVCGASPGAYGTTCDPTSVDPVPRPRECDDPDGNECNWCNCLVDDISWIEHISTYIEDNYCIDMSREYVLGFSQGGMMTHTVACELADRFAAATPFHGQRAPGFDCLPKNINNNPMPIMNVWGTRDQEVPGQGMLSQDGWYYITVNNVQEQFATYNGCDKSSGISDIKTSSDGIDEWTCVGWNKGCTNDVYVQSCSWYGTHTYPVRNGFNFGLNVSWAYMSQFQRIPPKSMLKK